MGDRKKSRLWPAPSSCTVFVSGKNFADIIPTKKLTTGAYSLPSLLASWVFSPYHTVDTRPLLAQHQARRTNPSHPPGHAYRRTTVGLEMCNGTVHSRISRSYCRELGFTRAPFRTPLNRLRLFYTKQLAILKFNYALHSSYF